MRKIESEMLAAIRNGKNWAGANTTVAVEGHKSDQSVDVYLHGNRIACYNTFNGWRITLAGWNTNTTRSRLRALLTMLGGSLAVKGGTPYLNGTEITTTDWHAL
jgi:hypothetical protein